MINPRLMGLFALVPTTLLLTVSFFVLVVLRKVESQVLRVFGYVVAALLWLTALLAFSAGIYTLSTGHCPMKEMMQGPMCGKMPGMMSADKQPMMKENMPSMMQGRYDEKMMKR